MKKCHCERLKGSVLTFLLSDLDEVSTYRLPLKFLKESRHEASFKRLLPRLRRVAMTLVMLVIAGALQSAQACSVCFGVPKTPQTTALKFSVLTLLIILLGVLVGFAWFFIGLMKRSREGDLR